YPAWSEAVHQSLHNWCFLDMAFRHGIPSRRQEFHHFGGLDEVDYVNVEEKDFTLIIFKTFVVG
ncbi:11849_t:CDS:1, partial [Funneliformis caledonium]